MPIIRKLLLLLFLIFIFLIIIWYSGGRSDFDEVAHAEQQISVPLQSKMIDVGEVNLHVVFAGPEDGEPVILIHGFPEFWYMWRYHMDALAKAGYRVVAPDMRGSNRSDKPKGRAAYEFRDHANDILGLMDTQNWPHANIVSHDIGARVTWDLVFSNSARVKRAVIYSVGHPLAFKTTTSESDVGWYRTFFQLPFLPEFFSRIGGLSLTAKSLKNSSRAGTFSDEEIQVYRSAWERDHAFDSMIRVYSDFDAEIENIPKDGSPEMPVLFVFGLKDKFISKDVAERTKTYLGEDNVKIYPDLSHWILAEAPEMTAAEILAFINEPIH